MKVVAEVRLSRDFAAADQMNTGQMNPCGVARI